MSRAWCWKPRRSRSRPSQVDGKSQENMSKRIGELRAILKSSLDRDRAHELIPTAREVSCLLRSIQTSVPHQPTAHATSPDWVTMH